MQRELPVEVALDLAMQACAGTHAVNELRDPYGKLYGLVHRDVTPHNLMVSDEGFVKLLDFGIAKATRESDLRTRTGVLKGKVAYMSPEQCQQEELDRRSDIFALGNVTWELLAGEKLFQAANELGVMQAIITGNVRDLRKVRPEVPDPVVNVIEHALASARDSRYDTADDMRRALAEAATASGLVVDRDKTAAFVREMLGEKHEQRRDSVQRSLDQTLITASSETRSGSFTQVTTATRVGLLGVLGALTLGLAGGAFVLAGLALVVA
ncbi:MAG: serine/threonine protein kinase, partial [Deltaproteobacteria bacterium]|nr:serine/threonine protein kinase [Deltaproteobacteria bacterium]